MKSTHGFRFVAVFSAFALLIACGQVPTGDADARDGSVSDASDAIIPTGDSADVQTRDVVPTTDVTDAVDVADAGCTSSGQCDDTVDCTEDACVAGVCTHTAVPARCTIGSVCDTRIGCQAGRICGTHMDCADTDPCTVNEVCDGATRVCQFDILDGDYDHFPPRVCGGTDCDDAHASVNPGGVERCNGIDENCDGRVDETFDLSSDVANCGACGTSCGDPATNQCVAGVCTCTTGSTACGGVCRNTATNVSHCGSCGHACTDPRMTCVDGACTCPAGQTLCTGYCVNLATSSWDCGACGNRCSAPLSCLGGTCACPAGQTACGGACVDLATDSANCGSCGTACVSPTACSGGTCSGCQTGYSLCSGGCFPLSGDSRHCGSCDLNCNAFQCPGHLPGSCDGGSCYWRACPAASVVVCSGRSTCIAEDGLNCGACGNTCAAGQHCCSGVCM